MWQPLLRRLGDEDGEVAPGHREMEAVGGPGGRFWNIVVAEAWPEWEARK